MVTFSSSGQTLSTLDNIHFYFIFLLQQGRTVHVKTAETCFYIDKKLGLQIITPSMSKCLLFKHEFVF